MVARERRACRRRPLPATACQLLAAHGVQECAAVRAVQGITVSPRRRYGRCVRSLPSGPDGRRRPFGLGMCRGCGPLRPLPGRRSLFPSSPTRCSVPRPDGRAPTSVGNRGLPQVSMQKRVVRLGGSLSPGERLGCRPAQAPAVILLTSHCGHGLSASLAMSLSRGFPMTLHVRSPFPAFPRPPPQRGWQRSDHCPQSCAPRMTRQHVWGGTPGHHGARRGSFSPSSILLHRPSEVSQEYACSLPGRKRLKAEAQRTLEGVGCSRLLGAFLSSPYRRAVTGAVTGAVVPPLPRCAFS